MPVVKVNKEIFKFTYLPDYANYILSNKLQEFVTVNIRFCREADLPLLKPLSKFSETELVTLSVESNRMMLEALYKGQIAEYIEENTNKWVNNTLEIIDRDEILAEDLTLASFLRRKTFAHFLDAYTKNVVLQKFIIAEIDHYTTQEELISYNTFLQMQHEKFARAKNDLTFYKEMLLEAQELGSLGSFSINFRDQSKTFYTPEYKRILELDDISTFDKFLEWVHPEDRRMFNEKIREAYKGGKYEITYRYNKSGTPKTVWSKGFIISDEGRPSFIRGVVREVTEEASAP